VVAGLGLVGWVAKTTMAQVEPTSGPSPTRPAPRPASRIRPRPIHTADLSVPPAPKLAVAQTTPDPIKSTAPATPDSVKPTAAAAAPPQAGSSPAETDESTKSGPEAEPKAPASDAIPAPENTATSKPAFAEPPAASEDDSPTPIGVASSPRHSILPEPEGIATGTAETEDPEKSVLSFVEKNRKIAETQLQSLQKEAETLRARLQKVESGMARWQAVVNAFKQSEKAAGTKTTSLDEAVPSAVPGADPIGFLEPPADPATQPASASAPPSPTQQPAYVPAQPPAALPAQVPAAAATQPQPRSAVGPR
jgi:hypothetical protein